MYRSTIGSAVPQQRADASAPGQHRSRAEEEPREYRRRERRGEDPDLRLLELATVEDERRDEEGDREADPGDRAAAGDRGPADGRLKGPAAHSGDEPGRSKNAERLAYHVADEDPERDRRRERLPRSLRRSRCPRSRARRAGR